MLTSINNLLAAIFETFKLLFRWQIWLPLLILTAIQSLVLLAHHRFYLDPFAGVISAWLGLFPEGTKEAFIHYPQHYIVLPAVFGWAKLLVAFLIEGSLLFLVAGLFWRAISKTDTPIPSFITRWGKSLLFWLVVNGLYVLVSFLLPSLLGSQLDGPRRALLFTFVALPLLYVVILCPFYYAIPAMAIHGDSVGGALKRSWTQFITRPFSTFTLALYILFVPAMLSAILSNPSQLVQQFRPEAIFWLFVVVLFAEMVSAFFWMGTAVRMLATPVRR